MGMRHELKGLFCGFALLGSFACAADTAAPSQGNDAAPSTGEITLPWGPLKFTAGPQSDGALGAALKGSATNQVGKNLYETPACGDVAVKEAFCNQLVAAFNFNVDAAWQTNINGSNSGGNNKNNATLTFDPVFDWMLWSKNLARSDAKDAADKECAEARKANPADPFPDACKKVLTLPVPWIHYLVVSAYPDLEYRYGTFNQSGTNYTANQFVYGGGFRLLVPTIINGVFANWPYLGVTYTNATNYGASNLPIAAGSQNRYLNVNGRVELNINWLRASHGIGLLVLADVTASHPTGASMGSASWQSAKLFQLIVDTGSKTGLKPALTYRTGTDKGMTYDRQVIFGVLWDIWNSK
ncbi:MAG TPA: hypothetical protein VK743_22495 [Steroidobacteraceae bacterium]|jgi:hypothetical protein|nr:hypothetical protein [Steroidobacteraceae bacterium]